MAFEPQNQLERSLMQAIGDPAWRPQFYRDFAASEIFTFLGGEPSTAADGVGPRPDQDISLTLFTNGERSFVPIFSSPSRLQAMAREGDRFIGVSALTLCRMVGGNDVFLNPGSPCSKEFTASEVAAIADGSIWESDTIQVDRPTPFQIGVPADYPVEFAESLKRLFAQKEEITRAWLALVRFHDTGESETRIGIEATHEVPGITAEIRMVAHASPVPNLPVTVMQVGPGGVPAGTFTRIPPFYERT